MNSKDMSLIVDIDQFVVSMEDQGVPFQEVINSLQDYIDIALTAYEPHADY